MVKSAILEESINKDFVYHAIGRKANVENPNIEGYVILTDILPKELNVVLTAPTDMELYPLFFDAQNQLLWAGEGRRVAKGQEYMSPKNNRILVS